MHWTRLRFLREYNSRKMNGKISSKDNLSSSCLTTTNESTEAAHECHENITNSDEAQLAQFNNLNGFSGKRVQQAAFIISCLFNQDRNVNENDKSFK